MKDLDLIPKPEIPFLVLTTIFFACIAILNIIGITKLIHVGPLTVAVGVLPYPLTFLCTDLISEIYGKRRANFVVWLGLLVNFFVLGIVFLAQWLPSLPLDQQPPWQTLFLAKDMALANGQLVSEQVELFDIIYTCTTSSIFASMVAYLCAQFADVYTFHFFKKLTKGKCLWLRNNASTMSSQWIDTTIVIGITFGATMSFQPVMAIILSSYCFKLVAALLDTPLFYLGVNYIGEYIRKNS